MFVQSEVYAFKCSNTCSSTPLGFSPRPHTQTPSPSLHKPMKNTSLPWCGHSEKTAYIFSLVLWIKTWITGAYFLCFSVVSCCLWPSKSAVQGLTCSTGRKRLNVNSMVREGCGEWGCRQSLHILTSLIRWPVSQQHIGSNVLKYHSWKAYIRVSIQSQMKICFLDHSGWTK